MRGKKTISCLIILLVLVSAFNLGWFMRDSFFFNIKELPEGEFMFSSMSPDGVYTVRAFRVDGGRNGYAIRGDLVKSDGAYVRNIYWETGTQSAMIGWLDDRVITINGHAFDVEADTFDWRNQGPQELPTGNL